jgi:hypothetical protein
MPEGGGVVCENVMTSTMQGPIVEYGDGGGV